jgi:hypothetical protein
MSHLSVISNMSTYGGRIYGGELAASWGAAKYYAENKIRYQQMEKLLSAWDLGLSGVELMGKEVNLENSTQKIWQAYGRHQCHKKEYTLPFSEESSGTQAAFFLLAPLLSTLAAGGVAIIDELENDLHPHMLEPILDLFANPKTNPHNAQIFFSCHAAEILNLLDYVGAKNNQCESSACRLDAVGVFVAMIIFTPNIWRVTTAQCLIFKKNEHDDMESEKNLVDCWRRLQ